MGGATAAGLHGVRLETENPELLSSHIALWNLPLLTSVKSLVLSELL